MKLRCLFPRFLALALAFLMIKCIHAGAASAEGMLFDGKSALYEAGINYSSALTVEAWVKPGAGCPAGGRIVDQGIMSGRSIFRLETGTGGTVRLVADAGGETITSSEALPTDRWSCISLVVCKARKADKTSMPGCLRLYVDGKETGAVVNPRVPPLGNQSGDGIRLGGDYAGGHRFIGHILRVAVNKRVLSAEEIAKRAAGDAPEKIDGVLGDWTLPEGEPPVIQASAGPNSLSRAMVVIPAPAPRGGLALWYQQPAREWVQALPIGNGRLGGMVYGGLPEEVIQLNENTVWAGGPYDPANPDGLAAMREGRRLVLEGKGEEAAELLHDKGNGRPHRGLQYQTLGNLVLSFPAAVEVADYQRSLDLDTAVARTGYTVEGVHYTREVFASAPDRVIVVRLSADKPGALSFSATLKTPLDNPNLAADGHVLTLSSISTEAQGIKGQVKTHTRLLARNEGGTVKVSDSQITVEKANSVTLFVSAATNYVNWKDISADPVARAKAWLEPAAKKPYEELRSNHIADYQKLFRRVTLDVGTGENASLPTDERVRRFDEGKDPALAALFFQFGRYLLIASSRPGGQPATLQGIWNDSLTPAWGSKYTVNINAQMNYWPAETANLSECHLPLLKLVEELPEPGARTAKVMYGATRGWVTHHNTDGWRATAPIDANDAGIQPMGGAWLCTHLWEHYAFTLDKTFLKAAYPTMKGACEFFLETLIEHPKYHWLVTCPSNSPEHGGVVAGPTIDMAILRDLFSQTAEAATVLGIDAPFAKQILETRGKLAPFQIGRFGQLQEWLEDLDQEKDTHRHVSHLYALFPSSQISEKTPDLFKAARVTLDSRGDAGTGWSLAWKINFWARLLDGDRAYKLLSNLLGPPGHLGAGFEAGGGTFPNLFDAHPPFQIDGNFGATSGMVELLLQSHAGEIVVLPSLPKAWPNGAVKGLRARGGFEVDLTWKDRRLARMEIRSTHGLPGKVRYGGNTVEVTLKAGESAAYDGELHRTKGT